MAQKILQNNMDDFFKTTKEIGQFFDNFILKEFGKRNDSEILLSLYKKFLDKKIGIPHQRVMFVYIAAKFFGIKIKKDLSNLLPLMAVPELTIWSNYALNWVTDEKNNISGTKLEENLDLIASQYLLTEILYFLPDRMFRKFLELYRWDMRGYLSVEVDITLSNFDKMRDEKKFWVAYSRNHAIPDVGALFAYCFEIVDEYFELKTDPKLLAKIRKIMLEFGRTLQISGDLSDFLIPNELMSTTEKRPKKDYFIDIRTDRLTYPVWLLMKYSEKKNPTLHRELINSAKNREYPKDFYWKVHKFIKEQKIVEEILTFLKHEKNRLTKDIEKLGIKNEGTKLWKMSMFILTGNKFVKQLKIDYKID